MRYFILFIVFIIFSNCVSTKVFNDLESRYAKVKIERNNLLESQDSLQQSWDKLNNFLIETRENLQISRDSYNASLKKIKIIQDEFNLLKENSNLKIQQSIAKNNALLKEIAIKETELQSRSEKVEQLEKMIQDQRQALNDLKETLSDALLNFQGKGLTVEQLNGKVYVSMENKLLFKSGKWNVEKQGIKALKQLANVLVDNPDISILIEGHTDNVPVNSKGDIKSNWDLSTKRATAVVEILLQNEQILPQNLTAAGRSEYLPIAPNSTFEGRAANRRIEIILSPSLDKITTILEKKN